MKQRHVWLLLLVASLGAGALLLARKHGSRTIEPLCDDTASCAGVETVPPVARTVAATPPPTPSRADSFSAHMSAMAPTDGAALREEADRLIREGEVREGLDVFREAVEADPSAKNHGDLGEILYRLSALDEAGVHLRAAAELDPGNADRWIALANLYYRKVDLGEAWKAEKRAREAEPGLELGRDADGMRVRKSGAAPRDQ